VAGTTLTASVNGVTVFATTDASLSSGSAGVAGIGHFSASTAQRVTTWEGGNGTGGATATAPLLNTRALTYVRL
jgi:hypothetical protein